MEIKARLTVFFEDPFWVGVCERETRAGLEAARVVFGAEPTDGEVYLFFLDNFNRIRFSPPVAGELRPETRRNPKRMRRAAQQMLDARGAGTKAQQALNLQREQSAEAHAAVRREHAEEEKQRRFDLRQQKKKEKHRGR